MTNRRHIGKRGASAGWWAAAMMALAVGQAQATATAISEAVTGGSHFPVATDGQSDLGGPGQLALAISDVVGSAQIFSPQAPGIPVGVLAGSANASAEATEGTLRARSNVVISTSPLVRNSGVSRAGATAQWTDFVILSSPLLPLDTIGYFTANMVVSGAVNGSTLGTGSYGAVARFTGTGLQAITDLPPHAVGNCAGWSYCAMVNDDSVGNRVEFLGGGSFFQLQVPVVFGQPISLSYTLDVTSIANAISDDGDVESFASGSAQYGSTVRWAGITGVFDAFGNPVTQFSVSSQSGFDYAARATAVPLPSTLACLLGGLWALAGRSRRTVRPMPVQ